VPGASRPPTGRGTCAPISGSATAVFHRYYDDADLRPNYVRHRQARAPAASAPGE